MATARDFKINGVTPSAITVGGSTVNLVSFSNQGYVWARPLSTFSVARDSNIKSISISKTSVTAATDSASTTDSSKAYSNWLLYGDSVTVTATKKDTEQAPDYRTLAWDSSPRPSTRTIDNGTTYGTNTTSRAIDTSWTTSTSRENTNGSNNDSRTETDSGTDSRTVTSGGYTLSFNGNGNEYGSQSSINGSQYQPQIGDKQYTKYGTKVYSQPGTVHHYKKGTHYDYYRRDGTNKIDQSRDVYQSRTLTTTYSVSGWSGSASSSTDTVTITAYSDSISESVTGSNSTSASEWSTYDYGSWHDYNYWTDWGDWYLTGSEDVWNSSEESGYPWTEWNTNTGSWSYIRTDWTGPRNYIGTVNWRNNGSAYNGSITIPSCNYIRRYYNFDYWSIGSTSGAAKWPGDSYDSGTSTAYVHWSENAWVSNSSRILVYEDTSSGTFELDLELKNRKSGGDWYNTIIPTRITVYTSSGSVLFDGRPSGWSSGSYTPVGGGQTKYVYNWDRISGSEDIGYAGDYCRLYFDYTNGSGWGPSGSSYCDIKLNWM